MNTFDWAFPVAVPFWALMIFLPGWSWTRRIIGSPLMILPSLAVYFVTVAPILPEFAAEMLSPDLAGVLALLSTPAGTSLVWAHLLAFDLFIGRWMYLDSRERAIHPLAAPILVLTILLSPFGLLAYLIVRQLRPVPRYRSNGPSSSTVSTVA
ncbi:ABA4-like family protein [Allorhizocola rhizosphaerae]|uniref:ABA4-like family protein n=1 Tax=Allorhizocola rhizosphaerae TaxID=1872709 RepID=UPI000E3C36C6|nr:ABA4-like family protein [Allorhizocola rhizosphaerae]